MRRAGPILILLIGVLALAIDFFPGLRLPDSSTADGTWRPVETKLGLDLSGGLRVEYQARPGRGQAADARRHGDHQGHRRAPGQHDRRLGARRHDPGQATAWSSSCRASPTRKPSAQLVGTTGRLDFVPSRARPRRPQGQTLDPQGVSRRCSAATRSRPRTVGTDQNGRPAVNFVLKDTGKNLFADYTRDHIGEYFAITLDNAVVSAPVINDSIPNGNVQITGRRARRLLREGGDRPRHGPEVRFAAVPDRRAVERADQRHAGLASSSSRPSSPALIGIALVITFMLIYYRLPGGVASFALIYYTLVDGRDLPARSR